MQGHGGGMGVNGAQGWPEYAYQQQQQPAYPGPPHAGGGGGTLPPQNGYGGQQGWNGYGQQHPQHQDYYQQQHAQPPPHGGLPTPAAPPSGATPVAGPSGLSQSQMSMLHAQQRHQAQMGTPYTQQSGGVFAYDPPPGSYSTGPSSSSNAYPPAYGLPQPPPSHAPPPQQQNPYGGQQYVHAAPQPSAVPPPPQPPAATYSATAQRFQSTPTSSPAPPFQQSAPPQQHLPPQQPVRAQPPQPPPPPTAAALQAHLEKVNEAAGLQQNLRRMEGILQHGVYPEGGPRTGQPLSGEQRAALERQVRDLKNRELAVINECEVFIRANGGSGNVHHYVERYQADQAAQQQRQQQQQAMYAAASQGQPQRPPSATSYQQAQRPQPVEMGLPPGHGNQRVVSYGGPPPQMQAQMPPRVEYGQPPPYPVYAQPPPQQQQQNHPYSPHMHHPLPPPPQQQPPPTLPIPPTNQQPGGMNAMHSQPQYLPQPPPGQPQGARYLPSQQPGAGGGGPPGLVPQPSMESLSSPHPSQSQPQQPPSQSFLPHPLNAQPPGRGPPPPSNPATNPLAQLPPGSVNPPQPLFPAATVSNPATSAMSFSPDLPAGLRAQMAAAAREQAQRALSASRAKMTNAAVRPALTGEMPVLTMTGFKTKEEWEKMEKKRLEEEAKKEKEEKEKREREARARKHPCVVLAEQAAASGGQLKGLAELVQQVQSQEFWEQLKHVMAKRGQAIAPQGYTVEGRPIDLLQLWRVVVGQCGGYIKSDALNSWPTIASHLSLPSSSTIPGNLKELYYRILSPYEDLWGGSIVRQREKDRAMAEREKALAEAKRTLEAKGHGAVGGGAAQTGSPAGPTPGASKPPSRPPSRLQTAASPAQPPQNLPTPNQAMRNAAPSPSAAAAYANGQQQLQSPYQPGSQPAYSAPPLQQQYLPPSASPAAYNFSTPASLTHSTATPPHAFSAPLASIPVQQQQQPQLGSANFPLSSAPSGSPFTASGLPLPAPSPGGSSMFASGFTPFTPHASLPPARTPGSEQAFSSLPLPPSQYYAPPPLPAAPPQKVPEDAGEKEGSIEDVLAQAAELRAERLAEKAAKEKAEQAKEDQAAKEGGPDQAKQPSPAALAARAAGQVAPFSSTPSVVLSRTNSTAPPLTASPAALESPKTLLAGRKRDRDSSREPELGDSASRADTATTTTGGSPSPHSVLGDLPPPSTSTVPAPPAASTPAGTALTPGAAAAATGTPSAQLAQGVAGGLTISTPPVPSYAGATSTSSAAPPPADALASDAYAAFAGLNGLGDSPALGGGAFPSFSVAGDDLASSSTFDFSSSHDFAGVGDLHGQGLGDFPPLPEGFDFSLSSSTSLAADPLKTPAQPGHNPDDWASGLLDFEFAADGFGAP
ncbi:hypothetical protein JCM10213v2_009194 [Rhodosporidiobolus nylandii]